MIIIFDTNVWRSHLYMNAPLRASTLLYVQNKGGKVALPEVVRLEVERHLRTDLASFRDSARDNYTKLLKIFGKLKEATFPTDQQIDDVVRSFFDGTGFPIRDMPFTLDHARDSFIRTVEKKEPSHRSQQFKDGVIWSQAKTLALECDVLIVTGDKGFFEGEDINKGLAKNLRDEAADLPHGITVFSDIYKFLEAVREPIVIDIQSILDAARASEIWKDIGKIISQFGLHPLDEKLRYEVFATERPNVVAIACDLIIPCTMEAYPDIVVGEVYAKFDCIRNQSAGTVEKFAPHRIGASFTDPESGEDVETSNAYVYPEGLVIGHREITNTFKEPVA